MLTRVPDTGTHYLKPVQLVTIPSFPSFLSLRYSVWLYILIILGTLIHIPDIYVVPFKIRCIVGHYY